MLPVDVHPLNTAEAEIGLAYPLSSRVQSPEANIRSLILGKNHSVVDLKIQISGILSMPFLSSYSGAGENYKFSRSILSMSM